MAKNKHHKTNAVRLIEQKKIPYSLTEFEIGDGHLDATEVAKLVQVSENQVYKTLITTGKVTGPVVAVIPSYAELDLKKLAKISGNKKIELLPLKELETVTGYIRGGCSPIGMKKSFPTYIDRQIEYLENVYVSAGKRGMQVHLSPLDLIQLTNAVVADICLVEI